MADMQEALRLHSVLRYEGHDLPGSSEADALLLDLESRESDRNSASLRERQAGRRPLLLVRVHALNSGLIEDDLAAAMAFAPNAIVLPGAVGGRDVAHLGAKLAVLEAETGLADGSIRIIAHPADTAAGVLALATLPGASRRLAALAWRSRVLARELGCRVAAEPVRQARSMLVLAAAAAGVPALDWSLPRDTDWGAAAASGFHGGLAADQAGVSALDGAFRGRPSSAF
jgi:citrate lyase subunit beta/citryl-CoA lyase